MDNHLLCSRQNISGWSVPFGVESKSETHDDDDVVGSHTHWLCLLLIEGKGTQKGLVGISPSRQYPHYHWVARNERKREREREAECGSGA